MTEPTLSVTFVWEKGLTTTLSLSTHYRAGVCIVPVGSDTRAPFPSYTGATVLDTARRLITNNAVTAVKRFMFCLFLLSDILSIDDFTLQVISGAWVSLSNTKVTHVTDTSPILCDWWSEPSRNWIVRIQSLGSTGWIMSAITFLGGNFSLPGPWLGEASILYYELGDQINEADALEAPGVLVDQRGDYQQAYAYFEQSIQLCDQTGGFFGFLDSRPHGTCFVKGWKHSRCKKHI